MNTSELIQRQRAYFDSGATLPIEFRLEQLRRLAQAIKRRESDLHRAIYEDFGKSSFDNYTTELMLVLRDIDEAIACLPRWSKPKRVHTNVLNWPGRSCVVTEPLGVSLVIGAWNYPYLLSLSPVVPALAAGNTVVLKPSELPRMTSRLLAELIGETFDPRYCAVVEGGATETAELLTHRLDKIFFTGSTHVGKIVYQAAASRLTKVTLELGGKTPVFVDGNCDLPLCARRLVWGKFLNAGQTCIAPDYVLVDARIEEDFLKACRNEIVAAGYATAHGNFPRIINTHHYERLMSLIEPAKVYWGGQGDPEARTIEPTILRDVSFADPVMAQEVFGPLLPVLTYANLDTAIDQVRRLPKPLSCYVFSNNRETQQKVVERVSAGAVTINDVVLHIANPHLPFGGVGDSGMGRYHGETGFRTFSNEKSILLKARWPDLSLRYSPQTPRKLAWLNRLARWPSQFRRWLLARG